MKKTLLTAFVIATFALYSYHQRHDGPGTIKLATAPSTSQSPSSTAPSTTSPSTITYKDGQFTGSAADAFYGLVQVQAVISGGKLTDVKFLQTPNDRETS